MNRRSFIGGLACVLAAFALPLRIFAGSAAKASEDAAYFGKDRWCRVWYYEWADVPHNEGPSPESRRRAKQFNEWWLAAKTCGVPAIIMPMDRKWSEAFAWLDAHQDKIPSPGEPLVFGNADGYYCDLTVDEVRAVLDDPTAHLRMNLRFNRFKPMQVLPPTEAS